MQQWTASVPPWTSLLQALHFWPRQRLVCRSGGHDGHRTLQPVCGKVRHLLPTLRMWNEDIGQRGGLRGTHESASAVCRGGGIGGDDCPQEFDVLVGAGCVERLWSACEQCASLGTSGGIRIRLRATACIPVTAQIRIHTRVRARDGAGFTACDSSACCFSRGSTREYRRRGFDCRGRRGGLLWRSALRHDRRLPAVLLPVPQVQRLESRERYRRRKFRYGAQRHCLQQCPCVGAAHEPRTPTGTGSYVGRTDPLFWLYSSTQVACLERACAPNDAQDDFLGRECRALSQLSTVRVSMVCREHGIVVCGLRVRCLCGRCARSLCVPRLVDSR
mmetsp:Transcript_50023/g.147518  ORF Transcript_50023/g.147518 Transcript_50023/m.147518 type:complete len:332 (-) Transcript_50023:24-1019(-)